MADLRDPFREKRQASGLAYMEAEGEQLPLILRLQDVRKTCKDWQTFSAADPFMITPHSEAQFRSVPEYPLESDPPVHTDLRAIVEPFFNRPKDPAYQAAIQKLVNEYVAAAAEAQSVEVVREVAVPIQSRGLAMLLDVDDSEGRSWMRWGVHVYKDGDGVARGRELENYLVGKFEETRDSGASDFFSTLNRADYHGRKLTHEEKLGLAVLVFAGGRNTVIHTMSNIFAYFAQHPEQLEFLREDPARIIPAGEEFVRYVTPVTTTARRCPHGAQLVGTEVAPGARVGISWPSANYDETVFNNPTQIILDRTPNPHVGFGFGIHKCLGAAHARLIIRSVLRSLLEQIESIDLIEAVPRTVRRLF